MKKELYKLSLNKKLTNVNIDDDSLILTFKDEDIIINYNHEQDCCERVYADFSVMKYFEIQDKIVKNIIIKGVEEMGFLISLGTGYKVFIPCYNEQNGYYSDKLELKITDRDKTIEKIDISRYVKPEIDKWK